MKNDLMVFVQVERDDLEVFVQGEEDGKVSGATAHFHVETVDQNGKIELLNTCHYAHIHMILRNQGWF